MKFSAETRHVSIHSTLRVCKNILHPSGYVVNLYYITYYGLKDEMLIFQFPFMAESRQTLCAKRFSNLSQTIFHSQPNDFPFSSLRNEAWLKDA